MNRQILQEYGISFQKINVGNEVISFADQETISDISYSISGYLNSQPYKAYLEEELLMEIDKAQQGLPFESDGGGDGVSLTLGYPKSTFITGGVTSQITASINTEDLKEVILSWVEFLEL